MKTNVVITGASGLIGNAMLNNFDAYQYKVYGLYHQHKPQQPCQSNVSLVKSDITKSSLGIDPSIITELNTRPTIVLNCAANTNFSQDRATAEQINVAGTRNVLDFASRLKKLVKIGQLSTIYVAGKQTGTIPESYLITQPSFVNEYERSKFLAEEIIQKYTQLPVTTYRLSTVIANNEGVVEQYNSLHQAIKLYYNGLVPVIPAKPACKVDLITSDFAGSTIYFDITDSDSSHPVVNVCSGSEAMNVERLVAYSYELFLKYGPNWQQRGVEEPKIVDQSTYKKFCQTVELINNPVLSRMIKLSDYFFPQLMYPKTFINSNALKIADKYQLNLGNIETIYDRMVKYCIDSKWGRITHAQ